MVNGIIYRIISLMMTYAPSHPKGPEQGLSMFRICLASVSVLCDCFLPRLSSVVVVHSWSVDIAGIYPLNCAPTTIRVPNTASRCFLIECRFAVVVGWRWRWTPRGGEKRNDRNTGGAAAAFVCDDDIQCQGIYEIFQFERAERDP